MAGNAKTSDLGVRAISALVMAIIAGTALWLGAMAWMIFVLVVGVGVWFEWSALVLLTHGPGSRRTIWRACGAIYCGIACAMLITLRDLPMGMFWVLLVTGSVFATDIGAYAFGRAIGGPKIAPRISPSKTWAGLIGGIAGASLVIGLLAPRIADPDFAARFSDSSPGMRDTYLVAGQFFGGISSILLAGAAIAILAQAGDFFESWMKRRAGVKDSGKLIPGHGGLFDRVDGLLAVLFVLGVLVPVGRFL